MRAPLASVAPFDIGLCPFPATFAPGSSVPLAIAPPKSMLQLFERFQEGLSEIHVGTISVRVIDCDEVAGGKTCGLRSIISLREAREPYLVLSSIKAIGSLPIATRSGLWARARRAGLRHSIGVRFCPSILLRRLFVYQRT